MVKSKLYMKRRRRFRPRSKRKRGVTCLDVCEYLGYGDVWRGGLLIE